MCKMWVLGRWDYASLSYIQICPQYGFYIFQKKKILETLIVPLLMLDISSKTGSTRHNLLQFFE